LDSTETEARDQALITRMRDGDSAAFAELLDVYWRPVVRYVNHLIGSVDAAEDIAQEAFVRVWTRRSRWDTAVPPRAILYRIARNLALNEQRSARVRSKWAAAPRSAGDATPTAAQSLDAKELKAAVDRAIQALPERRREVFQLVRFAELTYREVAELMGISVQTVANQMTAALSDLRRVLEPFMEDWSSVPARRRPFGR